MTRKATLIGASGLIGSHLLEALLADDYYTQVVVMVRKTLDRKHPKLLEYLTRFDQPEAYIPAIEGSETVFCSIGTTMKKVSGDRDAYVKVDYDIAVTAAKTAARCGVYGFVLVSSVGADPANQNNFYLKLKGVIEETVAKEAIPMLHIFRPSLLLGYRAEKRFTERLAQVLAPVLTIFLQGNWRKYKPIKAGLVAGAMLAAGKSPVKGIFIHQYDDILKLAATTDQHPA
jgi:uncharacterized protein YbjT (DUF2867 family)